ncbi:protein unc-50 homolog isoform X2 [Lagenorhynchus albirostris]|uniref:protein unc-50 homolog isoform X2 n=1 Tax=Lagenorhynchus albirostris TaxID=27610 RepID=UPI0028EDD56A|nr:protein unc-50 homolog isoform X2 [Lagenorhynchus albirostris]
MRWWTCEIGHLFYLVGNIVSVWLQQRLSLKVLMVESPHDRKMLPSTSVNSPVQGNGVLSSRDAARHTAGAKRYKYLRRLFRFRQMDFEFAAWQMLYLFTSPQRVYRNFHYRKQTKDQWARDDPAFLVLLSLWLCVSTIGFGFVLDMGFFETIKLLLWVVFIDCVGVGLLISTLMWFISNKYLVKRQSRDYDVEWGYAFDVHLNAFYPLLVILHFIQLFFINHVILTDTFIGYLVGNTLWLVAVGYYIYVTFLGYSENICKVLRACGKEKVFPNLFHCITLHRKQGCLEAVCSACWVTR